MPRKLRPMKDPVRLLIELETHYANPGKRQGAMIRDRGRVFLQPNAKHGVKGEIWASFSSIPQLVVAIEALLVRESVLIELSPAWVEFDDRYNPDRVKMTEK